MLCRAEPLPDMHTVENQKQQPRQQQPQQQQHACEGATRPQLHPCPVDACPAKEERAKLIRKVSLTRTIDWLFEREKNGKTDRHVLDFPHKNDGFGVYLSNVELMLVGKPGSRERSRTE